MANSLNLESVEDAQTTKALLKIIVQASDAMDKDEIQPIDAMRISAAAQRKLTSLHNDYKVGQSSQR